jgi:hypothetical protein|tara:strand:+ start:1233 stop:1730 length:498 start_codon:yes stop_codon:yes gene_type:complete
MEYILRTAYPSSPPIDTIVTLNTATGFYETKINGVDFFYKKDSIENYHNWKFYQRTQLNLPIGSFIVFLTKIHNYSRFHVSEVNVRHTVLLQGLHYNKKYSVDFLNSLLAHNKIVYFETVEEAANYQLHNNPCLSLNDVATIYSSAKNIRYTQYELLKTLINSKQ